MRAATKFASAGILVAAICGLLFTAGWMDSSDAKPKKVAKSGGTCNCVCQSEERVESVPGKPSRYSENVSFEVSAQGRCSAVRGVGCNFKRNGVTILGTLGFCDYRANASAANTGNVGGVDPTGGNGPSTPFSRPGILLNPNP